MTGILDRGIQIDGLGMKSFITYESNVLFALRFMIDCNIVGGNWIEVPVGKYKKSAKNLSYCQLEFDCLYPHSGRTFHPQHIWLPLCSLVTEYFSIRVNYFLNIFC